MGIESGHLILGIGPKTSTDWPNHDGEETAHVRASTCGKMSGRPEFH